MGMSLFEQKTEEELWVEFRKTESIQLRDAFIRQYMPLVKYVAGKVAVGMPGNVEFDDLVGFEQFGLLDAINKFDPEKNVTTSASWSAGRALTSDNYLITPKVEGARRVEFYANVQDATSDGALGDHFAVCASSTGMAASDFTVVFEDTPAATPPSFMKIQRAPDTWRKYVVNLPADTKYMAFRHYNCTNFFRVNIDDITII